MTTSARLRCTDGLPGHWTDHPERKRISVATLAAVLGLGLAGCLGALQLVLRLYPLA